METWEKPYTEPLHLFEKKKKEHLDYERLLTASDPIPSNDGGGVQNVKVQNVLNSFGWDFYLVHYFSYK